MASIAAVAFVRAVMIGREGLHRGVLLDIVEGAGGRDAASYISTGNVSFVAEESAIEAITERIESAIAAVVGRPTPLFVRRLDVLAAIVEQRPFAEAPFVDPSDRIVTLFRTRVPDALRLPIVSKRGDFNVFAAGSAEVFSVTRAVGGRTQAPGGVIERMAGEPVTSRAWATIERIVDALA